MLSFFFQSSVMRFSLGCRCVQAEAIQCDFGFGPCAQKDERWIKTKYMRQKTICLRSAGAQNFLNKTGFCVPLHKVNTTTCALKGSYYLQSADMKPPERVSILLGKRFSL